MSFFAKKKQKHLSLRVQISAPVTDALEFLVRPHRLHVLYGLLDAGPGLLAGDALSDPEFVAANIGRTWQKQCSRIIGALD